MITGSKSYLKQVKAQVTKDLQRFEEAEKEYVELFKTLPISRQEFINKIVNLKIIHLDELERRLREIKRLINTYETKFLELQAKLNLDARLQEEFGALSKYELADKEDEVEKKIMLLKKEDEKSQKAQEKINWINSVPVAPIINPELKSFPSLDEAEVYFKDNYDDYIECGQGVYQDEAEVFCYINDRFIKATIKAEVFSQKMDKGDRLYWVERISSVSFTQGSESEYNQKAQEQVKALAKEIEAKQRQLSKLSAKSS